jgi:ribose transport system ATP-binding protein
MLNVSKTFGGVQALKAVDFAVAAGEIHALVGENGAGKSTLMNILSGAVPCDQGRTLIDGVEVKIGSPEIGRKNGIAAIYQEFALAQDLSVAENVFLNRLSEGVFINWKEIHRKASMWLAKLGVELDPSARVGTLSVAFQQIVEICKAISEDSRVLILDEPTAVLAGRDAERLFAVLRSLRAEGVSIIYVSHRLEEVFQIADRITVLRDGSKVGSLRAGETEKEEIIRMMIGRNLEAMYPPQRGQPGEELLRVDGLSQGRKVRDVSFSVRSGEILGIAGLVGSGRTEAVRAVFGADPRDAGTILVLGREVAIRSPRDAVRNGVVLLPEDRKNQGVLLEMSVRINTTLSSLKQISKVGWIEKGQETALVERLVKLLGIKVESFDDKVSSLSGGNQQKVVLARWLASRCKVIILDEPTRGVDVGAKVEIYSLIDGLARQGVGILVVSSDLQEVTGLCDRVLVMRDGAMVGELRGEDRCEENILRLALGERVGAAG